MTWITTATVLEHLRDFDNRQAWDSFNDRFRRPIVSFARSMGLSPTDADDVAQETLIAFAEAYRQDKWDPAKGRLSRFLFGIAYRQALRARRQGGQKLGDAPRVGQAETHFWSHIPDEETASGVWDSEWEQAVLQRCLEQVRSEFEPQTYRAFELTVREEQPPAEAAEILGIGIKSVYNAKHRILKRLRELREQFDSHAE